MARLSDLRDHIEHIEDLRSVVGAIRSISAVRVEQARGAINAIREHTAVVEHAISESLPLLVPGELPSWSSTETGTRHIIVFCSEHGFSGKFNNRMLDHAEREARSGPPARLGIVGTRGVRLAASRDLDVAWTTPMATHTTSVPDTAREIESVAFGRFDPEEAARIDVLFARSAHAGSFRTEIETLFPFDLERFRAEKSNGPPVHYLDERALLGELITEFVLAEFARITMESFLAENASRMQAMEAAKDNIDSELESLQQREREQRNDEITEELFDIVGGYEALRHNE